MKLLVISTRAELPRWTQKTDLSGSRYVLEFGWSARQEAWLMSVSDAGGSLLLAGIRLVPGVDLLAKYRASRPSLPPGVLYVMDRRGGAEAAEMARDNFGTRFALAYLDRSG